MIIKENSLFKKDSEVPMTLAEVSNLTAKDLAKLDKKTVDSLEFEVFLKALEILENDSKAVLGDEGRPVTEFDNFYSRLAREKESQG